jgi:hypothetical protein
LYRVNYLNDLLKKTIYEYFLTGRRNVDRPRKRRTDKLIETEQTYNGLCSVSDDDVDDDNNDNYLNLGARSSAVCWATALQAVSIPDGVIGIFH